MGAENSDNNSQIEKQNPSLQTQESEYETEKKEKSTCRKIMKFIFSTAGLFVLNIAYLMIGALIFHYLEQHNEVAECVSKAANYNRIENASVSLMVDVIERVATSDILQQDEGREVVQADYQKILQQFSAGVLSLGHDMSVDCSRLGESGEAPLVWSFIGSLEFSMTVTTTIGYGRIYPKTVWGKLACIAYALIGIPLMLTCLAVVGDVMAKIFRYIYATVCCCGCCFKKASKKDESGSKDGDYDSDEESDDEDDDDEDENDEDVAVPLTISMVTLLLFTSFGAAVFSTWEGWSFIDSIYFCFITYSTIGLGDMVPGMDGKDSSEETSIKLFVTGIYEILGMAWLSMCFQLMQNEMVAKIKWLCKKLGVEREKPAASIKQETAAEGEGNRVKSFRA